MEKNKLSINDEMVNGTYFGDNDEYPEFLESVKNRFNSMVKEGVKLFTTDVVELYKIFIDNLPAEARQHYTCNACKSFFNKYGGLVTITNDGVIKSVLWNEDETPSFFKNSVRAMKNLAMKARVNGVFISEFQTLGQPVTGEWHHLSVKQPTSLVHRSRLLTSGQVAAEKLEDYRILTQSLVDYSFATVNQALALLESETLYRSDKVLGVAKWFKELIEKRDSIRGSSQKNNIVWLAVATAPTGFTHVRSSMIGTLLQDIVDGYSAEQVARRFAEKMTNYMRSQVAPSQGNIQQAENIVEKLGIANSLKRRYATFEEIPTFIWKNRASENKTTKQSAGVFANITPKDKSVAPDKVALPSTVMTWEKFQRTVLPTAENIEVMVDNPSRLMALVTASDETSENILQWNNPFSWYYHGGIDGEIKRRVERAGGRYENNEIRASLIWESYSDLDIHCITPLGEHISYRNKRDNKGGFLDIDMNAGSGQTNTPVENIRWASNAPEGRYRFYVHNFADRNKNNNPYKVELEVNGKIFVFNGVARGTGYQEDVFVFDYRKGQQPTISSNSYSSDESWTVPTNSFVKVNGITNSPNLWDEKPVTHSGTHVFFLLDGCKDLSEGKGRGFFNETLKPELREVRKTLEAYTANTPIEDADKATASGVGYSKDNEWNLTLKVTSNNSTRIIKIDRWD